MAKTKNIDRERLTFMAVTAAATLFVSTGYPCAQPSAQSEAQSAASAGQIADAFGEVGDQIFDECVFELSEEQINVQSELIKAYVARGVTGAVARKLAASQIQPPRLSERCKQVSRMPTAAPWTTAVTVTKNVPRAVPPKLSDPKAPILSLAAKKPLPQWDCAAGVDFVTIHLNGYERKLTGGEICNPFEDVVKEVPAAAGTFRLGYTIKTGRLFVVADDARVSGQTIAWGLSGRDVCRNNPDADCLAAKAVGPLPPGEYTFAEDQSGRVSWGPRTKRNVAGIYLKKLWNKERYNSEQLAAIMSRGNIAIHMRLKGEMSEACIGLEPKGWAYVASLIKTARAVGINVYLDEPYPGIAEPPPVVVASSFSLSSLFK